jgi:hypothetical protein
MKPYNEIRRVCEKNSRMSGKFDKGTVNMMKSQYIAHRIFRKGGMIGKIMNNPALKRFEG